MDDRAILRVLRKAISGGADVIQLRDKRPPGSKTVNLAMRIGEICRRANVPFIVNDRCEVALAVGADGVHVGQGDLDLRKVRRLMGYKRLIGVSVNTTKEAMTAKQKGADYLGVGPIFETPIKKKKKVVSLKLLDKIRKIGLPVIAIGGINLKNVRTLIDNGFKRVAVIRAVSSAGDPYKATRLLKEMLLK